MSLSINFNPSTQLGTTFFLCHSNEGKAHDEEEKWHNMKRTNTGDFTRYIRFVIWRANRFFFLIFWVHWVTWWLLMWRRGYLASCPGGEGGSISRSYCDTRRLRPLMSSQQQAEGAEKTWGLSKRRPGVSRLGGGVSIHSQCRLFKMREICTWTERKSMPFKTVDESGRWECYPWELKRLLLMLHSLAPVVQIGKFWHNHPDFKS